MLQYRKKVKSHLTKMYIRCCIHSLKIILDTHVRILLKFDHNISLLTVGERLSPPKLYKPHPSF